MITLPGSLQKNQPLVFSLNKSELFAAVSDEYFSIEANVKKVVFVYKSTDGHQRKRVEFLTTDENPSDSVVFSLKAKNVFNLEKIVLMDYDGGAHVLSASVAPSALVLDFTGEGEPPSVVYFAFDGTSDNGLGGFGSVSDSTIGGEFYPL